MLTVSIATAIVPSLRGPPDGAGVDLWCLEWMLVLVPGESADSGAGADPDIGAGADPDIGAGADPDIGAGADPDIGAGAVVSAVDMPVPGGTCSGGAPRPRSMRATLVV